MSTPQKQLLIKCPIDPGECEQDVTGLRRVVRSADFQGPAALLLLLVLLNKAENRTGNTSRAESDLRILVP